MLACPERRQRDLGVCHRHGQIQDDLDLLISDQLPRRAGFRYAEGLRLLLGPLGHEVGTRDHLDVVEYARVFEVDAADLAATDDAYSDRAVFCDGEILPLSGYG